MVGPGVRVVGADRAAATLQAAEEHVDDLDQSVEVADVLAEKIREREPIRTGRLRRGTRRVQRAGGFTGVVADTAYAGVINNGWPGHHIEAQRFVERGIDAAEPEVERVLEHQAQELLDTVRGA